VLRRASGHRHGHGHEHEHEHGQRGSGSVLVIAVLCTIASVLSLLVPLYGALVVRATVAHAADAAALAAADARVGAVSGFPCERARQLAERNGAALDSCTVDGLVATVTTRGGFLGFPVLATATAGPAAAAGIR
jgi:secretion/DNA translocation related TadE-like protein